VSVPETDCPKGPSFREDVTRLIESRFTGWICVSIIVTYLANCVGFAMSYMTTPTEDLAELARLAFTVYVVKKLSEKNGRASA
jgi:hypothetical protein